jgi:hypothetical protein
MPSSVVSERVLPGNPSNLVPTSTAPGETGNVLMGLSMICVELNRYFGIVDEPGRSLYESGTYSCAASVASTQGGTISFKPTVGRTLFRLNPGSEKPQGIRTGMDGIGPFVALHDESAVLIDMQAKRSIRIVQGKKSELDLLQETDDRGRP